MAGHGRPKDGVGLLDHVPAIYVFLFYNKDVDARYKAFARAGRGRILVASMTG